MLPYGLVDLGAFFKGGGTRVNIAGRPAWHGTIEVSGPPGGPAPPPPVGTAWFRSPLQITVVGDSQALTDKILAAILAALLSN